MIKLPINLWLFIWLFLKQSKLIVIIYVCVAFFAGFMGPINSMLLKHIIDLLSKSHSQNIDLLFWPAVFRKRNILYRSQQILNNVIEF